MQKKIAYANAQCDVLAYCLSSLECGDDFISTVCGDFARDIWGTEWVPRASSADEPAQSAVKEPTDPGSARATSGAVHREEPPRATPVDRPASMQPTPFGVVPGVRYTHPLYPQICLAVVIYSQQTIATVEVAGATWSYDLGQFPAGVWTQLTGNGSPTPIALNVQLPFGIFAAW